MNIKKDWQKPELVVLLRSKPEEAILWACKDETGPGAGGNQTACYANADYGQCSNTRCSGASGT